MITSRCCWRFISKDPFLTWTTSPSELMRIFCSLATKDRPSKYNTWLIYTFKKMRC
jgi:hypothetical protein